MTGGLAMTAAVFAGDYVQSRPGVPVPASGLCRGGSVAGVFLRRLAHGVAGNVIVEALVVSARDLAECAA
jgi:hypothetical protein